MKKTEIWNSAEKVWETAAEEILRLKDSLSREAFCQTVKKIAGCRGRIITCGAGTSGAAAKKIAHSLSCVERPSFYLNPADAVHGALGSVQPGDLAILISKGGGTAELVRLLPAFKAKKIGLIVATENPDSPLGRESDILLNVKVLKEADTMNMLATTSTMAVTAVFDAVCITLMKETNYRRDQFALIHPGGAVGKRLTEGLQ